jgi:hypothetical protein
MHLDRLLAAALTIATASVSWSAPPTATPSAYLVELEVLPDTGQLAVAAEVTLLRDDYLVPTLQFRLHESFDVHTLTVNGRDLPFTFEASPTDRNRPASRTVTVTLPEELRRPQLTLKTAYGGAPVQLPQFGTQEAATVGRALDDAIGPRRVELAYYSAWYPQFGDLGPGFAADLAVTLPEGWTAVCTGEPIAVAPVEGRQRIRWATRSANDLVVVASPDFQVVSVERSGAAIEVYHTRLPKPFINREAENARKTLDLYQQVLGDPGDGAAAVRVVYSPRAAGQGGYARPPMIVLSEGRVAETLREDPRLSLLRGTAHEAAHFWWNFGSGQGDWINEAFAEYFALVSVERVDSPDQYRQAITNYTTRVDSLPTDAPALAAVPASNEGHGYTVRYYKGALMLHALRQVMGDDRFFGACRDFYQARTGRATSTEELRSFWNASLGDDAALLDRWLETPGGVPSSK